MADDSGHVDGELSKAGEGSSSVRFTACSLMGSAICSGKEGEGLLRRWYGEFRGDTKGARDTVFSLILCGIDNNNAEIGLLHSEHVRKKETQCSCYTIT